MAVVILPFNPRAPPAEVRRCGERSVKSVNAAALKS